MICIGKCIEIYIRIQLSVGGADGVLNWAAVWIVVCVRGGEAVGPLQIACHLNCEHKCRMDSHYTGAIECYA